MSDISEPDLSDEDSVKDFFNQLQMRSEMIAKIPDYEMPMDFHIYEIKVGDNCLEMHIDYMWEIFAISYSGNMQKIAQALYIYYGVSEDDIREKTERYSALLAVLSA